MQGFLVQLLGCSVTMSALALFYMAVSPLLAKRYSAKGRYYAWLVLVVGLIIPVRPQWGGAFVKVELPGGRAVPTVRIGNGAPMATSVPIEHASSAAFPELPWWQVAAAIWLMGALLFLGYHAVRHFRFWKLADRWSESVTDRQTLALLQSLKMQMGISRNIGLRYCDSIGSPMLIGLIAPRILLPKAGFAEDELRFILRHELVHEKRKDLWYKCLVLLATAIHWFNPIIFLMARAIDVQCELSCDDEVVRGTDADTRLHYSETIIGVIRYHSKRKTAFSTHFYGGKKGMKTRIFSIMDMGKKKAGAAVLCGALLCTLGTGAAFAANAQKQPAPPKESTEITPWIGSSFLPDPGTYAKYADFGLTVSEDGTELLYEGRPVRLFADEKSDTEAFYLDEAGALDLSAVRNAAGELTGLERISSQEAQAYYEDFFAEELGGAAPQEQDTVTVRESVQDGPNKYEKYEPFGVTYSAADGALYQDGQRVKFLTDQSAGEGDRALWTDAAGAVNLKVKRDAFGRITGIDRLSDEKAREYQAAAEESAQSDSLEKKIEDRINALYPED